jgi:hypothetical protein
VGGDARVGEQGGVGFEQVEARRHQRQRSVVSVGGIMRRT